MRALSLVLALLLPGVAAAAEPTGAEFLERLRAMGPVELRVAEDMGPVLPRARAKVSVSEPGLLTLDYALEEGGPPQRFVYNHLGEDEAFKRPAWDDDSGLFADRCRGGGSKDRFSIRCWTASALRSRALRPPSVTYDLFLAPDGLRIVRKGFGPRLVFTPLSPAPRPGQKLEPGAPANLGDALAQLDALDQPMFGGASGGGDWYGSDLIVSRVRGLDFVLERTVLPNRGGRSGQVPARWSFDYQGPPRGDSQAMTWVMVRRRPGVQEADFFCVGRHAQDQIDIRCHRGRGPSSTGGTPDIVFRLRPFPKWMIYVDAGPDNPFASVGTAHLEPLPFP